jgi:hypothetical protein
MASDAVREFIDQIDSIPEGTKAIDVLIHSTGGDALTAWKLMSILRERFDSVSVLVPFIAFSAATLFALGADEIIMHPHASLGPIDPQLTIAQPSGNSRHFAYEDVGAFLRFLQTDVKVTEPVHVSPVVEKLFSVVDPVHIGFAKRASELASSVGERLLLMHMSGSEERPKARQIAENLNKSFFAHGDAVSRTRAKELQLKIANDNPDLSKLMWSAYLGLESYMDLRKPFHALQHYLSDPEAEAALKPAAPVVLPSNTPQQVSQAVWNQIANQAVQNAPGQNAKEVDFSIVNAVIESVRVASEYRTVGRLTAHRNANGNIQLTSTDTRSGWTTITEKPVKTETEKPVEQAASEIPAEAEEG